MSNESRHDQSSWTGLYKENWMQVGGTLFVIGLLAVFLTGGGRTVLARWGVRMMGLAFLMLVYAFTPAMGKFMSGDREWDELSTKEQLIQSTKWAFVGAIVLLIGIIVVSSLLP